MTILWIWSGSRMKYFLIQANATTDDDVVVLCPLGVAVVSFCCSDWELSPLRLEGISPTIFIWWFFLCLSAQRKAGTRPHSWNTQRRYLCMIHINRRSNEATLRCDQCQSQTVFINFCKSEQECHFCFKMVSWDPRPSTTTWRHTHTHTLSQLTSPSSSSPSDSSVVRSAASSNRRHVSLYNAGFVIHEHAHDGARWYVVSGMMTQTHVTL